MAASWVGCRSSTWRNCSAAWSATPHPGVQVAELNPKIVVLRVQLHRPLRRDGRLAEQAPPDEGLGRCPLQVPVVGSKPSSRLVLVNRVRELLCRLKSSRQLETGPSVVRRGLHDLASQGERACRVPAPGYERREATPDTP